MNVSSEGQADEMSTSSDDSSAAQKSFKKSR